MDELKNVIRQTVSAACDGDYEALLMAQMLLEHLKQQTARHSCIASLPGVH